jgi:hypothetical protein
MKKLTPTFCLICFLLSVRAQNVLQFKVSKPYCVFNFLETANRMQGTSSTFNNYILANTKNDTGFQKLCAEFGNIQLNYQYKRDEFPENRRQYRSTKDLIDIALVNSNSLEEFKSKTIGILPNSSQQQLISVLQRANNYYDQLVWNGNEQKINDQKTELSLYVSKASEIFSRLHHFYQSSWSADVPFVVALYPIPGRRGNSTATPHANSLCVGVLADETSHVERICVVLHEICHVLYDEQTAAVQHELEKCFDSNRSRYRSFAHNFFDEGLATALGNGWAYQNINGKADTTAWYNNEYINGYAKEMYPLVEDYMNRGGQIDKPFVDKAIDLFAAKFPEAPYNYAILINHVSVYADAETSAERREIWNNIGGRFQLSSTNLSTPIADENSLEMLRNNDQTQLVIVDRDHVKNMNVLQKIFPQLTGVRQSDLTTSHIFSFYDGKQRPIIILYAPEKKDVAMLVKKMSELKSFDKDHLIQ